MTDVATPEVSGGAPARPPSPWLTIAQAAEWASVSVDTLYAAAAKGELRHVRVGGRRSIRLRPEWIDQWLEQQARGGEGRQPVRRA